MSRRRASAGAGVLALGFVCFCALSCIPVEDLGEYWEKGYVDKRLAGAWKKQGIKNPIDNHYLEFGEADGRIDLRILSARDVEEGVISKCKTLDAGEYTYLMIDTRDHMLKYTRRVLEKAMSAPEDDREAPKTREEAERQLERIEAAPRFGAVQLYMFDGEDLLLLIPDETILGRELKRNQLLGEIPALRKEGEEKVEAMSKLNDTGIEFLKSLAANRAAWREQQRYRKIDNLEQDLAASKAAN